MGKFFILTCANIVFGYAALAIVLDGMISLPLFHPYYLYFIQVAGPFPLLVSALWSAASLWQVRKVSDQRQIDPQDAATALARGAHQVPITPDEGPSGPEFLARALIWLAILAVPLWLGWPLPLLWAGMIYALWSVFRCAL